jgi:hypothetical protein
MKEYTNWSQIRRKSCRAQIYFKLKHVLLFNAHYIKSYSVTFCNQVSLHRFSAQDAYVSVNVAKSIIALIFV